MDKVFELLMQAPNTTIIGAVVLMALAMWLFKDEIKHYLIKRWNLYTEKQMKEFALRYAYELDRLEQAGKPRKDVHTAFIEYKNAKNRLGHKD